MSLRGLSLKRGLTSALALCCAAMVPAAAGADTITLRSADGTVNIVGEFIDFIDNSYLVKTGLGDIRVSATRVSCIGDACPTFGAVDADIKIAGANTLTVGIMPLLISGYAASTGAQATLTSTGDGSGTLAELVADEGFGEPIGQYLVTSSNSAGAFTSLLEKTATLGVSARRILPDEARALRADGAGSMIDPAHEHIIALDTIVVIVNPENPVETLTMDQLRDIYVGNITNWSELGGNDAPITLVSHAEGSDTRTVFEDVTFDEEAPTATGTTLIASDNNQMASLVNSDANAIGYSGFAFQRGAKPVSLINECGLNMTPDSFSARTEEYELQRALYLYNRSDVSADGLDEFLAYSTSEAAEEVISKAGFISLGVDRRPQTADSERAQQLLDTSVDAFEGAVMNEMLSQMVQYDRLSTTFRFRTGSQSLGLRGVLNLERLADYLEDQPEGTSVLFVGFTDDVGAFENNRQLSVSRAEQVRETLLDFAADRLTNITTDATGFGEIAPSACNISDSGRQINRRVEVWIKSANG